MTSAEQWSGQGRGWRYLARRITGNGTPGPWLDNELPLTDVSVTDVLSGPPQLSATISPVQARLLMSDGLPLLTEWDTEVFAEASGQIVAAGLLARSQYEGPDNGVEATGYSSYAKGMGYTGDQTFVETDPLDIVRHIWQHIQSGPRSNIRLVVDQETRTPVRVGKAPAPVAEDGTPTDSSQDEGPYRLATWLTEDLGGEIDDLARSTPFEYREVHRWNADKTDVDHFLLFGYPRLGQRRSLRFVLGENVSVVPTVERDGGTYANHVRVLGAGEGSAMIVEEAMVDDGRLRRMVVVSDESLLEPNAARKRARDELAMRLNMTTVNEVVVRMSEETPLGSWQVGDEIRLQAGTGWLHFDMWFRVISMTITPEDPDLVSMTLLRADRLAL